MDSNEQPDDAPLALDEPHANACHERWSKSMNRDWSPYGENVPDDFVNHQCGQCRFYIPLEGILRTDWGVCSNAASPFDRQAMFEHDGCDEYSGANEWVTAYLYQQEKQEKEKLTPTEAEGR